MENIKQETIDSAYRPFDVVTNGRGAVGFIQEVNLNDCQTDPKHQVSYAVCWLIGSDRTAWFADFELMRHCNLFAKIAELACNPMGRSAGNIKLLMKEPA